MMIVDCHIYAATLVAMNLSSSFSKVHTPARVVLKPFSASEALHSMAESTEESNVLLVGGGEVESGAGINKEINNSHAHTARWTRFCQHSKKRQRKSVTISLFQRIIWPERKQQRPKKKQNRNPEGTFSVLPWHHKQPTGLSRGERSTSRCPPDVLQRRSTRHPGGPARAKAAQLTD